MAATGSRALEDSWTSRKGAEALAGGCCEPRVRGNGTHRVVADRRAACETDGFAASSPSGSHDVSILIDVGAGVGVDNDVATRIANSIGPAFDGFAPIEGTLPFDLEPASFLLAQTVKVSR